MKPLRISYFLFSLGDFSDLRIVNFLFGRYFGDLCGFIFPLAVSSDLRVVGFLFGRYFSDLGGCGRVISPDILQMLQIGAE